MLFFSNLEGALNSRERRGYDRIIELDIDDLGIITTIRKVECTGVQKKFVHDYGSQFFSKVKIPTWESSIIQPHEMTSGALAELQKQFNRSHLAHAKPVVAPAPPVDVIDTQSMRYSP